MSAINRHSALDYINSFDDPYRAALRDHGKQTWGLARIAALLQELGNPHIAYPTIHVAGTKGKGSTSAMIAQALIEAGHKTGLYVSPHLEEWRERIQIDRLLISEDALNLLVDDFKRANPDPNLSAFEVATALAFWHFAREGCDAAVIEVGLGGRLDATNVVQPIVSVITNISMDHMQLLGDTLGEIAGEKAAIIKPGAPAVSAPQADEALTVIEQHAASAGSKLTVVGRDWPFQAGEHSWRGSDFTAGPEGEAETYHVALPGRFQIENAVTSLAALDEASRAGLAIPTEARRTGLATVRWPGRMEAVCDQPLVVIDSAHTPYSLGQLVGSLKTLTGRQRFTFVFGCMADKDIDGMLRALLPAASRTFFVQAENERAAAANDLFKRALGLGLMPEGGSLVIAPDIANAVLKAVSEVGVDGAVCVTGSLSVAGAARTALLGQPADDLPATSHHATAGQNI